MSTVAVIYNFTSDAITFITFLTSCTSVTFRTSCTGCTIFNDSGGSVTVTIHDS